MAIIVFEGFDHYAGIGDLFSRVGALQWMRLSGFNEPAIAFGTGRGGYGQALVIQAEGLTATYGDQTLGCTFPSLTSGFIGIALQASVAAQIVTFDLLLADCIGGSVQFTVRFNLTAGCVAIYAGDPNATSNPVALGQSAVNAFNPFVWSFIEIGATSSAEVRVQGASVVSAPNPMTSGSVFNSFQIRLNTQGLYNPISDIGSPALSVDDLYIVDTTTGPGTYACNGFLGDCSVRTLRPIANWSISWSPLTGANWQEVGEALFDGDTSYNAATSVGAQDLFTFQPLPTTTSVVFGVQVTGAYRKQDASAQTIVQNIVSGGTAAASAPYTLSLSYTYVTSLWVLDPATAATWTPASVDVITAGYELAS